jgi:hypothetical protein
MGYRALEYLDYLAEEELGGSFTISPDCKGSRSGGRCTLSEFLLHNWKGLSKKPPTGYKLWPDIPKDPTTLSIKDLVDRLVTAEFDVATKKGVHFKPITNVEPSKIFPSSPQLDYFDLLAQSGSRLGALKSKSGTLTDGQNQLVKLGQSAAEAVHELRYEDHEKFRITALKNALPFQVWTSPYKMQTFGRTFDRLDVTKTAWGQKDGLGKVLTANRDFYSNDKSAASHAKAIQAARISRMVLGCSRVLKLG